GSGASASDATKRAAVSTALSPRSRLLPLCAATPWRVTSAWRNPRAPASWVSRVEGTEDDPLASALPLCYSVPRGTARSVRQADLRARDGAGYAWRRHVERPARGQPHPHPGGWPARRPEPPPSASPRGALGVRPGPR